MFFPEESQYHSSPWFPPTGPVSGDLLSTWVPTDQSGASLTFTYTNPSQVYHTGRLVYITLDVNYPITVDASTAKISLPVAPLAVTQGLFCAFNGSSTAFDCIVSSSGVVSFEPTVSAGTKLTNSQLSSSRIVVVGTYLAA